MNKPRGLTVAYLLQKSNRQLLATICDDIVKVIDAKIQTVHQNGFSEMEQELPVNFSINGLDRQDAQTLVYSELIQIYKDKGFSSDDIGIEFAKGGTAIFHVRWLNGMEPEERETRRNVIKRHIWRST